MANFVAFLWILIGKWMVNCQNTIWCEDDFYPLDTNVWKSVYMQTRSNDFRCPGGTSEQCSRLNLDDGLAEVYRIDADGSDRKDMILTFKWLTDSQLGMNGFFSIQYICDESLTNWMALSRLTDLENDNVWSSEITLPLPDICDYKRNIGIKFYGKGSSLADIYLRDVCLKGTQSQLNLNLPQTIFCETDFSDINDWQQDGDLTSVTNAGSCPANANYNNKCGRIDTSDSDPQSSGRIWRFGDATGLHYITLKYTFSTGSNFDSNQNIEAQFSCGFGWFTLGIKTGFNQVSSADEEYILPYYCRNSASIGISIIVNREDTRVYFNDVCLIGYPWTAPPTVATTISPSLIPTQTTSLIPTLTPTYAPTGSPFSGTLTPIWCTQGYNEINDWTINTGNFETSNANTCPNNITPCISITQTGYNNMNRISDASVFQGIYFEFNYHSVITMTGFNEGITISYNCSNNITGSFDTIKVTNTDDDRDIYSKHILSEGCDNSEYIMITMEIAEYNSIQLFLNELCLKGWKQPTTAPTNLPSVLPTTAPSGSPTIFTETPSNLPTQTPSISPSEKPSTSPTVSPSELPTVSPSISSPTNAPTGSPSTNPTPIPTNNPTILGETLVPTTSPSVLPSTTPTQEPTYAIDSFPTVSSVIKPNNISTTYHVTVNTTITSTYYPTLSPSISDNLTAVPTDSPTINNVNGNANINNPNKQNAVTILSILLGLFFLIICVLGLSLYFVLKRHKPSILKEGLDRIQSKTLDSSDNSINTPHAIIQLNKIDQPNEQNHDDEGLPNSMDKNNETLTPQYQTVTRKDTNNTDFENEYQPKNKNFENEYENEPQDDTIQTATMTTPTQT